MKYSICIPAFKSKFLIECIESILNQTFKDFEIIILNDASPENVEEIVENFHDSRIRYYKNKKNVGAINVVYNWNKCLNYAIGEYIVMIGDDDVLMPYFLEKYNALIEKFPNFGVYHCRSYIINEQSKIIDLTNTLPEYETVYELIKSRIDGRIFFIGDYLFERKALLENGGFYNLPLAWGSDDLTAYISSIKTGIIHLNDPIFCYRRNNLSISSKGSINKKIEAIELQKDWFYTFLETKPKNNNDQIIWKLLNDEINLYIKKTKIRTIYSSIAEGSSNIVYWLINKTKFKLSISELLYAYILSYKEKYK